MSEVTHEAECVSRLGQQHTKQNGCNALLVILYTREMSTRKIQFYGQYHDPIYVHCQVLSATTSAHLLGVSLGRPSFRPRTPTVTASCPAWKPSVEKQTTVSVRLPTKKPQVSCPDGEVAAGEELSSSSAHWVGPFGCILSKRYTLPNCQTLHSVTRLVNVSGSVSFRCV